MAKINKNNFNNNRSFVNVVFLLLFKFNFFFILTKHLSQIVAVTFAVWCNSKISMNFCFLLHNFRHRRFILTIDLSTSAYDSFSPLLIKSTAFTFHLKKALYSFSLAYPNCRHHYSCTSGPFFFFNFTILYWFCHIST